jgi:hypothetical protein
MAVKEKPFAGYEPGVPSVDGGCIEALVILYGKTVCGCTRISRPIGPLRPDTAQEVA